MVDPRSRMSKFVFGVSHLVVKECRMDIVVHNMDISRLMVRAQHIDKEKLKGRSREKKRSRIDNGTFYNDRSDGHGHPTFRQRFSEQGSSNAPPRSNNERVSNPKPQGGNHRGYLLPTCGRYGKKHEGRCLIDMDCCLCCGETSHKMRDCLIIKAKGREGKQSPPSGSGSNAPKEN
ncbi:hypothetical protein MTR67_034978 [Solanum verrucosum]|uniref:CCHC-type domain-containing protein n=1 Tax=Solanum verrucosum TaxID=315347 RepID=A0AAF0U992_SOLVR|nr:hypothetical protein MTR67_034978 [Solanum verrucosum]